MLNQIEVDDLPFRFTGGVLVEIAGDHDESTPDAVWIDTYRCQHREGWYTIYLVTGGALPSTLQGKNIIGLRGVG